MSDAAASGIDVVNVTVLAGDPTSHDLPGDWDREARFSSAGAAARERRKEDARACELIGARPVWLPFRDNQYADDGRDRAWESLAPLLVDDAELILVPGFPLLHPDHAWLAGLVWEHRTDLPPIGFYVEQPYAEAVWHRHGRRPDRGDRSEAAPRELVWQRGRPTPRGWWRKQRALAAYSSQLRAMTRPGARVLARVARQELQLGGECLGFPAGFGREAIAARSARRGDSAARASATSSPVMPANGVRASKAPAVKPAAVILGGLANAVSVARALASDGVPVYALGASSWDALSHSRAPKEYVRPEGADLQAWWLGWLEREAPRLPDAVLLPCGDDGVELIALHRAELLDLGYHPFEAQDDVALTMLDKAKTYELANRVGVPAPRSVDLSATEDRLQAVADLGFPCALKPLHSHVFARHLGGGKVLRVSGLDELESALRETDSRGIDMLATEVIPGPPDLLYSYYSYIDENGTPLFHATKRKLRQYPVDFGAASYNVTVWDKQVAELGLHLFVASGLRGLAEVEFKRDPRDGALKLIECNHRFTGSNEMIRIAGIDLARLTYARALGLPDPPLERCRDGIYLWGPILDTRAFRTLRRQGDLTTVEWVRSLLHRQHFPVFRVRDPKPTATDVIRRAKIVLARR